MELEELVDIFGLPEDEVEDLLIEEGMLWVIE